MADEEAEQERLSRGGGGCVAELQRLGERLQELERELRESRAPAVEAATEYCQQLCQVRAPGSPPPFPSEKGKRAGGRAPSGRAVVVPALAAPEPPPGGSWEYEGRSLCVAAVVAAAVGGSRLGEGSCGLGGKSPLPFPSPNSGCAVPEAAEMPTARKGALPAAGREGKGRSEARPPAPTSSYCALGLPRPPPLRVSAPLRRASAPSGLMPLLPCFPPSRPRPRPRRLRAFVVRVSPRD